MAAAFAEAREQTIALAHQAANLPPSVTARHNDLGDLSVKGWLAYLEGHATRPEINLRPERNQWEGRVLLGMSTFPCDRLTVYRFWMPMVASG